MAGFADSIKANRQKILEQVDKKTYSIAWQLFTSVVYLSPSPANPGETAKGLLANQWYPQIGDGYSSQLTSSTSPYGSDSLARINATANQKIFYGKDGVMSMANNVSYAYRAEKLGWPQTSTAPFWTGRVGPYRMVALSILKVKTENQ